MHRVKLLIPCAVLFLFCASCTLSQADAPAVVIAGTPGLSGENTYDSNSAYNEPATDAAVSQTESSDENDTPAQSPDQPTSNPDETTGADEPVNDPSESQDNDTQDPSETATVEPDAVISGDPVEVRDPYPSDYNSTPGFENLSNDKLSWYYNRNSEHQPPTAQRDFDIRTYDAYYLGDVQRKIVYLTFDEGYENGYTGPILDILRDKGVQAAFFLTQTYIRDNPELCERIAVEGHVAANHSVRHISFPDLTDDEIASELQDTAAYYEETTGYTMAPFFRPPSGEYSVRTLALTQLYGYKTIFWSFAHQDWLRDDQPGKDVAYKRVMDNLHNGGIILLHAVSQSNTEALPEIIDAIQAEGYTFGSLYNLP